MVLHCVSVLLRFVALSAFEMQLNNFIEHLVGCILPVLPLIFNGTRYVLYFFSLLRK